MPIRQCSQAHCSQADPEIYQVCVQNGLPAGYPVLTKDANGPCTCSCSCLAFGTPIQVDSATFEAVEAIKVGDYVLSAGKDLTWQKQKVEFSQGTTGASRQKYTVLVVYLDKMIAVTSDHVFLMADGTLKTADRLSSGDNLTNPSGKPVVITSVLVGEYSAGFHHIATKKALPDSNLNGHLLNTNGVISGDYIVQISLRSGELRESLSPGHDQLPVVGSPEYIEKYGDNCLHPPQESDEIRLGSNNVPDSEPERENVFISASQTRLVVPPDACRFISDEEAEQKKKEPKRSWNDPMAREWTDYLITHHKTFFPNVTYHFDWADNSVNAYAWIHNGARHVAILGGIVRHLSLELEGIGLVLAHELSHHYGGEPTFPGGLTCEGHSDYHAVRTIMRKVWFGEYYITVTDKAIAQMAGFFGVPNDPTPPSGSAGCSHPPGACRIATYHAAVSLAGGPSCAY